MLRFKQIQHDSLLQAQVGPLLKHSEAFKALIFNKIEALLRFGVSKSGEER